MPKTKGNPFSRLDRKQKLILAGAGVAVLLALVMRKRSSSADQQTADRQVAADQSAGNLPAFADGSGAGFPGTGTGADLSGTTFSDPFANGSVPTLPDTSGALGQAAEVATVPPVTPTTKTSPVKNHPGTKSGAPKRRPKPPAQAKHPGHPKRRPKPPAQAKHPGHPKRKPKPAAAPRVNATTPPPVRPDDRGVGPRTSVRVVARPSPLRSGPGARGFARISEP